MTQAVPSRSGRMGLGWRVLAALVLGYLTAGFCIFWVPYVPDAFAALDDTTGQAANLSLSFVIFAIVALATLSAGPSRSATFGRGLVASGVILIAGPALLLLLRATNVARPDAMVLGDPWANEWAIIMPVLIGCVAVWGLILLLVGVLLLRRSRA